MVSSLVSVIVPIYNTEKYLNKCVDSILNQTYKNIEVILVDDGSTDNSSKICDEYAGSDKRIKVIHKKNGGLTSSRESGIKAMQGDYAIIVDSDDWIDDTLIEECLKVFNTNDVDCVLYSYVKEHDEVSVPVLLIEKSGIIDSNFLIRRIVGIIGSELKSPEKLDIFTSTCMKMYKKETINDGVFFDTKYVGSCEDGLFNIYALKNTRKCYYINKQFYHYRKHSGETLSSSYRPKLFLQWNNLWDEFEKYIVSNNLDKEALNNRIALSMLGLGLNEISNPNKKEIKRNIKKYLKDIRVKNALKNVKVKNFSLKWKPFIFCCKFRLYTMLIFLLKIMQKLRRTR